MSYERRTWRVEGMHCMHCEATIERALSSLPGLREVHASYRKGTLTALWDAQKLPQKRIAAQLKREGYALAQPEKRRPLGLEALKLALLIAGLAALYWIMTRTCVADWMSAFPVARAGMSLGMLFVVGLMTSLHCVAMCGGINIAQSANAAQKGHRAARANVLYNLGRVISYTVIGGIIGALGMAFSISTMAKACIQIAAAAFMLIMALNLAGGFAWLRKLTLSLPRGLSARIQRGSAGRSSFIIGLANGLMPCGPLQSMQLFALSTGSWWMGALSMLCFSLGTVPLMLGIGLVGGRLNQKFAKPMRVISALLVVLMGMSMLTSGLALAGVGVAAKPMGEDGFAVIQGDRQYVRSEIDYGVYPAITVQAGIPVEWTIHAEESRLNGCNNEIVVPAYGLTIPLSAGENVVEFTPTASGVIPYTCWMGMIHGSIYVVDSLEDTDAAQSLIEQANPGEAAIIDAGVNGTSDLPDCCASILTGTSDAGAVSAAYSGGCCGTGTASIGGCCGTGTVSTGSCCGTGATSIGGCCGTGAVSTGSCCGTGTTAETEAEPETSTVTYGSCCIP